jgi:hypothetical protein
MSNGWTRLTRVYVYCLVLRMVLVVVALAMGGIATNRDDNLWLWFLQVPLLFVDFFVGLAWLHHSWSRLPYEARVTASGRHVEPGSAVARLFIPLYTLYWIFVANVGLSEAIDTRLLATGAGPRAPRGLAITACVIQLVPYLNWLVGPFVWGAYMAATDKCLAALDRAPMGDIDVFD